MSSPRLFCSDAARLRGDDNTATTARTDVWFVVEFPGTWGRSPIIDAALPPPVRAALQHALATVPRSRLLFIRRRAEPALVGCRVYVAQSSPRPSITSFDVASIEEVATLPLTAEALHPSSFILHPLLLVCTHGQRDSCCGRRGYPLYDALCKHEELDVWQCSHVGGDRFAANAVVLPWGLYYGPVEPRDAEALAAAIGRGEIFLPAYRGRSSFSRVAQAAETFVRRETGLAAAGALRLTLRESLAGGRTRVQLREDDGTLHEVTIEQFVAVSSALLTCTAASADSIPQFRLVEHRVTR
ncbi:MAG TPA: sucrase ferredoxin [Thermoanaerobaculia bacterium]|nr:sucrase ferredoxin [Thermoanaerobaculia bacterium]